MLRIIKESKKVTESFRQDFYDWYDGLNGYWQAKVDEFIEDEGYPDMITDLSEADMEIIMGEFNPEYFDIDEDEEDLDESCKTEASRPDNEFYGGGTVIVGLYGDDCGPYGSLDAFTSALKKAGIKILEVSGDEDYGWEMNIKGIAKEIYKLVDGKIPGYDCDDVTEFIEEYSLDPEEFEDHDKDVYSPEFIDDGSDLEEAGSPEHPAWLDEEDNYPDEGIDTSVSEGNIFVEDGTEYEWYSPYGDVEHLDFDAWQVWEAVPTEEDEFRSVFFVVDIDTGFIDWGPCDTAREALDFLRSKVDDYNEDL